ncbi:MAG: conjugal transfer protein [Acidimicrobiales bacterium]
MEMPTYTSIFTLRRKLYAIYDWELPRPVELAQVGVFVVGVALVFVFTTALGHGLTAANAWMFIVPPGAVAWYATQPVADEKTIGGWLGSQLRYLCEPRKIAASALGSSPGPRPPRPRPARPETARPKPARPRLAGPRLAGAKTAASEEVNEPAR